MSEVIEDLDSQRFRYLIAWETGEVELTVARVAGRVLIDAPTASGGPGGLLDLPRG